MKKSPLPDPFEWCRIPAGKFLYSRYEDRYEGEHQFYDMNYDYDMSKYPTTNAQYHQFIVDGGYDKSEFWTDIGWASKLENKWHCPLNWDDENYNQSLQPVVGISWYEAYAYSQWLGQQLDETLRLPSEPEWEKAARSSENHKYPWGNVWDTSKCHNSYEKINYYPSSVNMYPEGASHYGVMDLAGNVKEMCMTADRTDSIEPDDNKARFNEGAMFQRIVRGQFCMAEDNFAYTTIFRSAMFPEKRSNKIGFRLVRLLG